jgi:branched-chain amino acid transport system substrate-binding protein
VAPGELNFARVIESLPEADGYFLAIGGTSTAAFLTGYAELGGNVADRVTGGVYMTDPVIPEQVGADRLVGVVTAGPTAADSEDADYADYFARLDTAFPGFAAHGSTVFAYSFYTNMDAALTALEETGSYDAQAYQAALGRIVLDAPLGTVRLDGNRQAIAPNFVQELGDGDDDGALETRTIRTIAAVDASFGGAFSPRTPSPDRRRPECTPGTSPAWAEGR